MNLRGTNRASRAKPVSQYLRINYFFFWKNQANFHKRGRAGLERVNRFMPRFLKGRN